MEMAMTGDSLAIGIATRPIPDGIDAPCGDVALQKSEDGRSLLMLIDGLGHGAKAHYVAERARADVESAEPDQPLDALMTGLAERFRGTRGFVAAMCRIDPDAHRLEFCGIGNITTRLLGATEQTLLSGLGIVGQNCTRPSVRVESFMPSSVLLMHSDGISSMLRPSELAPALKGNAQAAAERMLDRFARPEDDAGVIVARHTT